MTAPQKCEGWICLLAVCALTVTLSDGGVLVAQTGRGAERGRRITLTQITSQHWCRKKETSPWQRKPPASVSCETGLWADEGSRCAPACWAACTAPCCYSLSANRHRLPWWEKYEGFSQAQPWHRGLQQSQVWTHTEAQYGRHRVTCSNRQIRQHMQTLSETKQKGCT